MFFKYLLLVELFHYYALWTELVNAHPRLPPVFKIPLPQFRFRISHERVWKFIWRYISNKEKITISNLYVTPSYLLSSWLLEVSAEGHIIFPGKGVGCDYISPINLMGQMGQPLTLSVVLSWILFSVSLFWSQERKYKSGSALWVSWFWDPFFASFYFGLMPPTDAGYWLEPKGALKWQFLQYFKILGMD